ncbi:hydroxymethylglutaryl-CoA synthase 1 isoform X2 [Anabrus simplex]|uniref:hydroxymethylglutaryl-CoA synthase 1 isoform X2 n=1 Tax=Anabrus simplex TaxID=316456 RepID=UPI0034DD8DFB
MVAGQNMSQWPDDVGIIAIELYFPSQYVDQTELEKYDGVSAGKYTIGLGQSKMGFCTDREDINSLCLTVVTKLMERNHIEYSSIGHLEVGTETLLDKSKSVKSVLMQLFEQSGNTDIEGVDTINACYGGTAALFNAVAWVESSAWDGRNALVVAGDIAMYAKGNARPTGGAGAIAMLIGSNAPLVMDRGVRASYMRHAYDFYKPDLSSEYPTVDGKLSIQCYLSALDHCYQLYCKKSRKLYGNENQHVELSNLDAVLFHSPFCKLVQKSLARLMLNDFVNTNKKDIPEKYPGLEKFSDMKLEDTYFDRDIEKAFMDLSKDFFEDKTKPSLLLANQVGNMYTPSLYGGLVSLLISNKVENLAGKRVALFSYGSGLASSMFSLHITNNIAKGSSLDKLVSNLAYIKPMLESRQSVPPEKFSEIMETRERNHRKAPYTPEGPIDTLFPGTWYLEYKDEKHRRTYKRSPLVS